MNIIELLEEWYPMKKYLLPLGLAGPGNQIYGIKEALIIAKYLDRTLILPPIYSHFTVNEWDDVERVGRHDFEEFFNLDYGSRIEKFDYIKHVPCIYSICKEASTIFDLCYFCKLSESIILKDRLPKCRKLLKTQVFSSENDLLELKSLDVPLLALSGIFNSVVISKCGLNGCSICPLHPFFQNDYIEICKRWDFSEQIKKEGDELIKKMFGSEPFLSFHLRLTDCPKGTDFKTAYMNWEETDVWKAITSLNFKNIYVAMPNSIDIIDSKMFNPNINNQCHSIRTLRSDKGITARASILEKYICSKSDLFVMSHRSQGGEGGEGNHRRSTWGTFVRDYRKYFLNNDKNIFINSILRSED